MRIGNLPIAHKAALAPMAGVADRSFRTLCMEYGAGFCMGELTSAKGVTMGDKKSARLLAVTQAERPTGVQLFGADPAVMAQAAETAAGFHPDFIDINMGCPAPKVIKSGGGSLLMQKPKLAGEIVKAVTKAVSLPVTVKIRAGWDESSRNAAELAKICEDAGAAMITVHGRTREQMYAPPADLAIIREVKKAVSVPVVGNGDIFSAQDAAHMYEETGCDYVMAGRGSLGAPWLFMQINALLERGVLLPAPPVSERMRVMLRHISMACEHKGECIALREARTHAAHYMRGLRGAAALRREAGTLSSFQQLEELAYRVCLESAETE